MVPEIKAGRLELVPPAAPGLSPVTGKEEVIIVCAASITGEQVAQIYNPDPFARPVFRSPVYQTPAGLILLAWLVRLIIRLLRLIIRHPVAALVLACWRPSGSASAGSAWP